MKEIEDVAFGYDKVASDYDTLYQSPECLLENAAAFSRVRGMMNGPRIADLGCGTGLLLEGVPEISAASYIGVDISEGMLERARSKFSDYTFERGCVTDLPLETASVGAAVSLFSVANYVAFGPLVSEIERILVPGGTFLLVFRRLRKTEEISRIPDFPFVHSQRDVATEIRARGFEDLRITGLTRPHNFDLFTVVQGRRSA